MDEHCRRGFLELEDGTRFPGRAFGADATSAGEVVFTTSLFGYIESLTDPSYRGQILVPTFPLIGNYGAPAIGDLKACESDQIQVAGLVVSTLHHDQTHHASGRSLHEWLAEEGVPGIEGIDTRALTLKLREKGCMLGRFVFDSAEDGSSEPAPTPWYDPGSVDLVAEVSRRDLELFGSGTKRVVLVDCGSKRAIRRELLARGVEVLEVPHDHDFTGERHDGVLISNGPGDPERAGATIEVLRRAMSLGRPMFGICLGSQLMALASGARTYKLPYGHRGQNQPCREVGSARSLLTSQNHGYAVDEASLGDEWAVWFENANDGSVEGIRHRRHPFSAVQFHPEARPGPLDALHLFDDFVASL